MGCCNVVGVLSIARYGEHVMVLHSFLLSGMRFILVLAFRVVMPLKSHI